MGANMLLTLLPGWLAVAGFFWILWLIQRRTGNAGIVDVGWAFGIGLLIAYYAAVLPVSPVRRILVGLVACAWSFRLGYYLFRRNVGKPEEGRYKTLREKWGNQADRNLLWFFEAQAVTVILLSLPAWVAMTNPARVFGIWDVAGVLVLLASVGGEAVADHQLAMFKRDLASKGKTCRAGLWRYSRHPNYFFEWLHWWVYVLMSIGSPYAWATVVAPLVMLYLLLKVTGIPATEAQAIASRGDDYREYQRTTSAFFPWFPREGQDGAGNQPG